MSKTRIIARLDIKNQHVIKGIQFDGLRKMGDPNMFAKKYYLENIDEIIFMDVVASLYNRNSLYEIINKACQEVFIPITVGGGIRTIEDIQKCLDSGADKVAINTQATKDPSFITKASRIFGKQCIVASIEAKKNNGSWEAYTDGGRERTGKNVIEWSKKLEELGAGELLLTSVDKEGTQDGFDLELCKMVGEEISIPLIISGGAGSIKHIEEVCQNVSFDGLVVASMLHYSNSNVEEIKETLRNNNRRVR